MNCLPFLRTAMVGGMLSLGLLGMPAQAVPLLTNGDFESGDFTGWTQLTNSGPTCFSCDNYLVAPGSTLANNAQPTSSSGGQAHGSWVFVTDQDGDSEHVLAQTFTLAPSSNVVLTFDMFINDGPLGSGVVGQDLAPGSHMARVDILTSSALPFSTAGADIVVNAIPPAVDAGPTPNDFNTYNIDITPWVGAGGTYQIRFGAAASSDYLTLGLDNIQINADPLPSAVPEPGSLALFGLGLAALIRGRRGVKRV